MLEFNYWYCLCQQITVLFSILTNHFQYHNYHPLRDSLHLRAVSVFLVASTETHFFHCFIANLDHILRRTCSSGFSSDVVWLLWLKSFCTQWLMPTVEGWGASESGLTRTEHRLWDDLTSNQREFGLTTKACRTSKTVTKLKINRKREFQHSSPQKLWLRRKLDLSLLSCLDLFPKKQQRPCWDSSYLMMTYMTRKFPTRPMTQTIM